MALSPIGLLGKVISTAYPFIRLGVSLGRSVTSIGNLITRAFGRAEASVIRRAVEAETAQRAETRNVLNLPPSSMIPDELMPEAITRQRRTYAWRTRFGFIEPTTGQRGERYLTVSTDNQLTAEQALEEARKMLLDDYDIDESFITDERIVGVTRAGLDRRL